LIETGVAGFDLAGDLAEGPLLVHLGVADRSPDPAVLARDAAALGLRSALVGAGFGGGAARLFAERSLGFLREVGRAIDRLGGRVLVAQGLGLSTDEMLRIREETPHVLGLPRDAGGSGDPSPFTALGVFTAIRALSPRLPDYRVGVQGVGRVGAEVARLLAKEEVALVVADTDSARAAAVAEETGADTVPADEILRAECDVLSPNARRALLDAGAIAGLRCRGIAGADYVVAGDENADALHGRRILAVPEIVAGSGWLLCLAAEREKGGHDDEAARRRVTGLESVVSEVFRVASAEEVPTRAAATNLGRRRLEGGR